MWIGSCPIGPPHHTTSPPPPTIRPADERISSKPKHTCPLHPLQIHTFPRFKHIFPIQVNSLVTDRVLLQRSLEQLRGELEEERRRREEAEERSARLGREVSQAKEKVEEFERRLREEGMSSSGVGSIHSDQDSGKHSDNSLVISRYCNCILDLLLYRSEKF